MTGDLETLAGLYGVQTSYVDAEGRARGASRDTLTAVLRALGTDPADPVGAVRAERLRRHTRPVDPVTPAPAFGSQTVAVSLDRSVHPRDCWAVLEDEDGAEVWRTRLMAAIQRPIGSSNLEGRHVDRYEVRLATPIQPLAPGYYPLRIEGPGVEGSSLVVVAPRCPLPARGWGAFLPLQAVRSRSDWGLGSYRALGDLAEWVAGLGGEFVGTLPLYPVASGEPGDEAARARREVSPYLPLTRLAWSELFVDPTALPEVEASAEARALLGSDGFRAALDAARRAPLVDYRATADLVRRALEPLARALFSGPSARREQLERFARARPDLVAYARFRAGDGGGAGRAPGADAAGVPESDLARSHLYAQWAAEEQLAAAGRGLYLDVPVGVDPQGFDPSFEPDAFARGVEGGAPPDRFFAGGQRWGFQPFHPEALREQRYRHLVSVLRHAMRRASVLRLDHVMGLHRLWWVPEGADATDGAYVGYHGDELRAIVALEAQRAQCAVVGEDLGTVPDAVRAAMAEDRMLRSWVLQFKVTPDTPLPEPPELAMASIGTHDLARFVTFFEAPERARWRRALGGDARRALRACLDLLAESPARLVLVDLEDLWLERWPHNRPGTGAEAGNWRHRCAKTLEGICADEDGRAALARLDALRRQEEVA